MSDNKAVRFNSTNLPDVNQMTFTEYEIGQRRSKFDVTQNWNPSNE